jgi:hypothetical protein
MGFTGSTPVPPFGIASQADIKDQVLADPCVIRWTSRPIRHFISQNRLVGSNLTCAPAIIKHICGKLFPKLRDTRI